MNEYSGSKLDDFLDEEGLFDEVSERAQNRLLALQIEDVMNVSGKAKSDRRMRAHKERVNHYLFNPDNAAAALQWLSRLARTPR